jgi:hypothetical protein
VGTELAQVLLREQHALELCMGCVSAPFADSSPFSKTDIAGAHRALQTTLKTSQRLFWNMLRGCNANRAYAAKYVAQLQALLGYSIGVASTLTEIFTDNDVLLDTIGDDTISSFIKLIGTGGGRQSRYMDFLICLCVSRGKARRRNQWRICSMFVQEHPELLLRLVLTPERTVVIDGDPVRAAPGRTTRLPTTVPKRLLTPYQPARPPIISGSIGGSLTTLCTCSSSARTDLLPSIRTRIGVGLPGALALDPKDAARDPLRPRSTARSTSWRRSARVAMPKTRPLFERCCRTRWYARAW